MSLPVYVYLQADEPGKWLPAQTWQTRTLLGVNTPINFSNGSNVYNALPVYNYHELPLSHGEAFRKANLETIPYYQSVSNSSDQPPVGFLQNTKTGKCRLYLITTLDLDSVQQEHPHAGAFTLTNSV